MRGMRGLGKRLPCLGGGEWVLLELLLLSYTMSSHHLHASLALRFWHICVSLVMHAQCGFDVVHMGAQST